MTEGPIQGGSSIAERVAQGDLQSLARLLRFVDDRSNRCQTALKLLSTNGKSIHCGHYRQSRRGQIDAHRSSRRGVSKIGKTVAVLFVDPSSPFLGGAILGDRIRMNRHSTNKGSLLDRWRRVGTWGVFESARDMIRVLDAYGFDVVLVETVGVGQDELEITRTAHTTLVVMAPGLGDDIQAAKRASLNAPMCLL